MRSDRLVFALALLLLGSRVSAQQLPVDRLAPAWSPRYQSAAEALSNVTLAATIGLDTWQSWQAPNRAHAFERQGERAGVVIAAVLLTKVLVHRSRPCAPSCGVDNPRFSFFSGHTAIAFAAVGPRLTVTIPLASSTGYFRIAANRHYLTDVLAGAAVGVATREVLR